MPCFVTTHIGDTLKNIVEQYYQLYENLEPESLNQIAKLNNVTATGLLSPSKLIVLPDSTSTGMCSALDYQAVTLADELNVKSNDPLKLLLSSERGEELLAALEFTEALEAYSLTKAFFGGSLGASVGLYSEFIKAHDEYSLHLQKYASVPARERRRLRRCIASTAKNVQELFKKIVAQMIHFRKNTKPKKLKMLPYSAMDSVKERGMSSVYLQDSADIRRVRWVARTAKVLGASALLFDVGIAAKNIKHAHETGSNSTRVAFEEAGGITLEVVAGIGAAYGATLALSSAAAFLPFAIIPGVGLIIIIAAGAFGAVAGNVYGKKIGRKLYENMRNVPQNGGIAINQNALNAL